MNKIWHLQHLSESQSQVLNHWQAFEVHPTGVGFIPLPGPNYPVFVGLIGYTGVMKATKEIVAFDPCTRTICSMSGEPYLLGPESGFTADMQELYRSRIWMVAAKAMDVTHEVLSMLEQSTPAPPL